MHLSQIAHHESMTNMSVAQILMCPPDFYGIEYEINPWMSRARPSDRALAARQWAGLCELLQKTGAEILTLPPEEGLPDLVFTANAALIFQKRAIISHFRHPERQKEEPHDAAWLEAHAFSIEPPPAGVF